MKTEKISAIILFYLIRFDNTGLLFLLACWSVLGHIVRRKHLIPDLPNLSHFRNIVPFVLLSDQAA